MNYQAITKLQKEAGYGEMQQMINTGQCWMMEGYTGRQAMNALEIGACMLPKVRRIDYYGNVVPSRYDVKPGTKGTFQHCQGFWVDYVDNGYVFEHETYI